MIRVRFSVRVSNDARSESGSADCKFLRARKCASSRTLWGKVPFSGTASHSVSNLPVGSHTFSVRATDKVGLETLKTRSFTIIPALSISDVRVSERSRNAFFAVRLSAASQQAITVNFVTTNGTAKAPADYAAKTGTLTFAPESTTQTIAVPIKNDGKDEKRTEYFSVNLSGPTNATIADTSGKGTIVDND